VRPLLAILGPTASGKSTLALEVAERTNGEIVTVDSAQIFVGLDVGTAKPTADDRARAPHHLIDVLPPTAQWTAADFAKAADAVIADVWARGRTPIVCGGTGLWYRALVRGIFEAPPIDPEVRAKVLTELADRGSKALHAELARVDPDAAARIAPGDPQRIGRALEVYRQTGTPISALQRAHGFAEARYRTLAFVLSWPREALWGRIEARTAQMYARGLLDEVSTQLAQGVPPDAPGLKIIGYRDAVRVVRGEIDVEAAREATAIATRQFAKRQRNWFNQEPGVAWIPGDTSAADLVERLRRAEAAV
jgi:tRNA dimethylallyltransferase